MPTALLPEIGTDTPAARTPSMMRQIMPSAAELTAGYRRLRLKAVSIATVLAASYWALVIADTPTAVKVIAAIALVNACVAVATSIMHDANHAAFSRSRRVNQTLAYTGDLLGASSLLWKVQHNDLHHRHTNVMGHDGDIEQAPIARLAPEQAWHPWHKAQHIYMWGLYGFLTVQWLLISDFVCLKSKRIGSQPLPRRVTPAETAKLLTGKTVHVAVFVALPMLFHTWWHVVVIYLACSWGVGFALAVIFQLAHCVDNAEFIHDDGIIYKGDDNVRHQLDTTVDISSSHAVIRWYLGWLMGGLDYQVEHHLAPRLPHTLYPKLAARVDAMCAANGLERRTHTSVWAALASHGRWLKFMGTNPTAGVPDSQS